MKLTVTYDNVSNDKRLFSGWGLSIFLEAEKKILFDTGFRGDHLLKNLDSLEINSAEIDIVVLSHNHWDHIGGLSHILEQAEDARFLMPKGFSRRLVSEISKTHDVEVVEKPRQITESVRSTGSINADYKEELLFEQALIVSTERGDSLLT